MRLGEIILTGTSSMLCSSWKPLSFSLLVDCPQASRAGHTQAWVGRLGWGGTPLPPSPSLPFPHHPSTLLPKPWPGQFTVVSTRSSPDSGCQRTCGEASGIFIQNRGPGTPVLLCLRSELSFSSPYPPAPKPVPFIPFSLLESR